MIYSEKDKGFKLNLYFANMLGLKSIDERHDIYGYITVIGRKKTYNYWSLSKLQNINGRDTLFIVCMDKNWVNIDRIYRILIKDIGDRISVCITENPTKGSQWYDQYRMDEDEEMVFKHSYNATDVNNYISIKYNEFITKKFVDRENNRQPIKHDAERKEYLDKWAKDKGYADLKEYRRILSWNNGSRSPMECNQDCSYYVGIHIAERKIARKILPILFGGIEKEMPPNHPGYDFIVKGGYKVNVKSRRFLRREWCFMISHNRDTDFFLLIGLNDEIDEDKIKVIRMWLFRKDDNVDKRIGGWYYKKPFWDREGFTMTENPIRIEKFKSYEITDKRLSTEQT